MTPTRRAKFTPPTRGSAAREREVTFGVAGGFHGGVPSQGVPNGFSPAVRNFVPTGAGAIAPRSALTKVSSALITGINAPVLGGAELVDRNGQFTALIASTRSLQWFNYGVSSWQSVFYAPGNQSWHSGPLSSVSTDYIEAVSIYAPTANSGVGQMYCVFSNQSDSLKYWQISATTTYSDFTWADSIDSTHNARSVCAINDRLVLFNTQPSAGAGKANTPTRVMWSARGNPLSFLVADGAGAEDLMEMHGEGQKAIRFRDFMLLFTEIEIWRATPTFDDYAFRFDRVVDGKGCPNPRTIVATPDGVVFLGLDHEVYITDGVNVLPLGPIEGKGESRIQAHLRGELVTPHRAWAMYNRTLRRYELYYSISGSEQGYPTRAMFYDFATQTWWPQTFVNGLTFGLDMTEYTTPFVTATSANSFDPNYFDSFGTAFRLSSTLTNDAGTAIDARWRSPGAKNATRKAHLKEVWIDADADSASSASVWVGSARSGSVFTSEKEVRLTTANDPTFVPVFSTDNAPAFEIRIADGGRPRIASFSATLQDASKF